MNWQERLFLEKQELDFKLSKLLHFLDSPRYKLLSGDEQSRLHLQRTYMKAYSNVLGERIVENPYTLDNEFPQGYPPPRDIR